MANQHNTLVSLFNDIANSIRGKTGDTNSIVADTFPDAINAIVNVQQGTADATATNADLLVNTTAYANGIKLEGTIPINNDSDITVSGPTVTVPAGYYGNSVSQTINEATFSDLPLVRQTIDPSTPTFNATTGVITVAAKNVSVNSSRLVVVPPGGYVTPSNYPDPPNTNIKINAVSYNVGIASLDSPTADASAAINSVTVGYAGVNRYNISGSASITGNAYRNVASAGYTGTDNTSGIVSGTATLNSTINAANVELGIRLVSNGGWPSPTRIPVLQYAPVPSGVTNAANGSITSTKPSSGVYVMVNAAANQQTVQGSLNVAREGYLDTAANGVDISVEKWTVGAGALANQYIPIKTGTATTPTGTVSIPAPALSFNTTTGVVTSATSSNTLSVTPLVSEGYVTSGTAGTITGSVAANTTGINVGIGSVASNFNTTSGNVEITKTAGYIAAGTSNEVIGISTQTVSPATVSGRTVTGYVNGTAGYTPGYNKAVSASINVGQVAAFLSHSSSNATATVIHDGNIATIGTTTKPSGNAGTDYYQIGFASSLTTGSANARAFANVPANGYVDTSNNDATSWSNKTIYVNVTKPDTYYVNKGTLVSGNISGAAFLENTGDYGFRATVVVPEGYHAGETVTKDFTTGIFPAPESKGTADKMLVGYSLYDEDGKLVTGNMPNQGTQNATITSQNGTYTIPAGYHDGNGVVKATLPVASINAPSGTVTTPKPTFSFNTSTGRITATVANHSVPVYANVTSNGFVETGTKSGSGTATTSSDTYLIGIASINPPSGTYSGPDATFTINNSTGNITATTNELILDVYANTTQAGYTPVATRNGNVVVATKSTNYKLNTVAGTTYNVTSSGTTVISAGQFATGDIIAKAVGGSYSAWPTATSDGLVTNASNGAVNASDKMATTSKANGKYRVNYTALANINTPGYVSGNKSVTGSLYFNKATATSTQPTASATAGTTSQTFNNILTKDTATNYKIVTTATGGSASTTAGSVSVSEGYAPEAVTASVTAKSASGTTNTTTKYLNEQTISTLEVTPGAAQNVTVSEGYRNAAINIVVKAANSGAAAVINTPSGSAKQSKPGLSFNSTTGVVTATVAATSGTAYANVTTAGYTEAGTKSGTFTMSAADSNTINVGIASINTPSGSKAQSTPTFSINTSTGVVTASVAATSGTAYANVASAGYAAAGTKSGTFTMSASSNTYNLTLAGNNTQTGAATIGASSATANAIQNTNIKLTDTATKYKLVSSANATSGAITAKTVTASVGAGYVTAGTVAATATVNAVAAKTASDSKTKYVNEQTISATTITPGAEQTVTVSEGYRDTEATITIKAASTGTAAVINAPSGSAKQSKPGLTFNATTGVVTATVAAKTGTAYANVTTAGYANAGTKSGTFSLTAADSNTINVGLGAINVPSGSKTLDKPGLAFNATTGIVTATIPDTTITAHANTATAGYVPTATRNAALAITGNSNTINVGIASINTPSGSKAQSTPTFSWDATNRKLTASVAATSGTAYANITAAGYTGTATKSGTFSMTASSNSYTMAAATLNTPSGTASATLDSVSIAYDGFNKYDVTGSASISGTAYRNVTAAGYTPTNTTSGTVSGTASLVASVDAPKANLAIRLANGDWPTTSRTPVLRYAPVPTGVTNAANGSITSTKPSSGVYVMVNAPANSQSVMGNLEITQAGYIDTDKNGFVPNVEEWTTGSAALANQYIPIKVGSATTPATSVTVTAPTMTFNTTTGVVTASAASSNASITPTVTEGYITAGTAGTVTVTSSSNTYNVGLGTINAFSATYKAQSKPTFSVNTQTGVVTASVAKATQAVYRNVTAGYTAGNTTGMTFTMNASSNTLAFTTKTGDGSNYQNNLTITPGDSDQTIMNRNELLVANHIIVKAGSAGTKGTLAASSSLSGANFTPTLTYNSTAGSYSYGGSNTVTGTAYANVSTNGYVDTTNNTSASNTKAIYATGTLAKTNITTAVSGTITRTPVIAVAAVPSGVTNAANGAATTTAPNSGIYVAVQSPKNTATATATVSSATAGYSDGTNYDKVQGTKAGGAAASAVTYVPINAATSNTQTGAATVTGGSASVALSNITESSSATNFKIQINTTGGSVTAKTVTASAGPGYVASGTVSATATVNAATGAANNKTVYLKAATPTNNTQTGAATIGSSGANATTTITGMETTTTNTGFIVSASANATSGAITAKTVTATGGITDGYSNVAVSAVATATVNAVAAKTASNTNTQYIKAATISDFSAKYKAQSKPTFAFNATTGIVTASVAATTQAVYRNVTTGYVGTANTTGMTFTMNASSNTYNVGLGSRSAGTQAFISAGSVTNASNNAVNASDNIALTTAANGRYRINVNAKATTTAGYIAAGTSYEATGATYINKSAISSTSVTPYTNGTAQTVTVSEGYVPSQVNISVSGVAAGTIATPSGSAAQSTPTFAFNTTTGIVTASVAAKNGTAYRNVTKAGYLATSTTGGNFQMTASSNTYNVGLGTVSDFSAKYKAQSKPTFAFNTTTGIVTASVAQTTQAIYRNVSAGYVAANTTGITFTMNASSNTYNVGLGALEEPFGSERQAEPTFAFNTTTGVVTATVPVKNGTMYSNVAIAGYLPVSSLSGNYKMLETSNTYNVGLATRSAGSASVLNNSNGNVRYYINTTAGYTAANTTAQYLQLNTKAGGTTTVSNNTKLVNAGQFVIGAIYAQPSAAVYTTANADLSCPLLTVV